MTAQAFPADNDHEGNIAFAPQDTDTSSPLDDIRNGLKVWADVGLTLGTQLDRMTKTWSTLMQRLQHNTPVDYGIGVSGVFPATGNLVLIFGTPDQGTFWEVESVLIGGVDVNTVVAGSAGLYVSAFVPPPGGTAPGGMTSAADRAAALPNVAFYGRRDLIVNDQEYLFLVIFGGTAGTTYAGNMSATVTPVDAAGGRDVITL